MEGEISDHNDEYHESKEDLTSASGSESVDEDQGRKHQNRVQNRPPAMTAAATISSSGQERPPLWSSSSSNLNSKFLVWKDNPGSIQDRRQRFFQQTGFKNLRGEQQQRFGRGSGGSLSKSLSSSFDEFTDVFQACDGDHRVDTISGNGISMQDEGMKGVVYRIRDLDSGKEFVVDEFGTDGTLEKFKDVDTGKELTLEEFESSLGLYPVMQELKRREREADRHSGDIESGQGSQAGHVVVKKKGWLGNIKASTWQWPQRIKVRSRRKSCKQLSELHLGQKIEAHQGAIWTMKFSCDGHYLASAGQDQVVCVWEIVDHPLIVDSEAVLGRKSGKVSSVKRKSADLNNKGPHAKFFWLSNKAMRSFRGHTAGVLDLSWSHTQVLLSSSMDKTVRMWHMSYEGCLRVFSHNDYVTCIQFNPVDEHYFLSGAFDDKVRIWSIPDHHVVDWTDLGERVTALCYTPDGKRAIVGSYKGTCRYFNTTGNRLQLESHIDVRDDRNRKSRGRKITGLQCMPGNPSKVLVTSNDSCIRVYDQLEMISEYRGLRNVNSQISGSFCGNGELILSASEHSRVYVWNSGILHPSTKSVWKDRKQSCEEFYCHNVSVAIPWPGVSPGFSLSAPGSETPGRSMQSGNFLLENVSKRSLGDEKHINSGSQSASESGSGRTASERSITSRQIIAEAITVGDSLPAVDAGWGLVIVTGSLGGQITIFHNYGLPIRL
ncbi:unnamed protein product [Sphagnum troendelagicum]|uniref:WD repeat-containing protein 44 n=1 Tax=Sphagnum troendelagicum TaxID=128251 RepID=A0ABP0U2M4_9BRYO